VPIHAGDKMHKIRIVALRMSERFGREPSDDEVAEETGLPRQRIAAFREGDQLPTSLDREVNSDLGAKTFGDTVPDPKSPSPSESLVTDNLRKTLMESLEYLTQREKFIVVQRFGLLGVKAKTLDQVGAILSLTRERVRQIGEKALAKLRRSMLRTESGRLNHVNGNGSSK
jgi:RNA polymerase primary sigma factor